MIQDMCKKTKQSNIQQKYTKCYYERNTLPPKRMQIIQDMLKCDEKPIIDESDNDDKSERKSKRIYMNNVNDTKKLLSGKVNNIIKLLSYYTDYPELNRIYTELKSTDYDPFKFKEYVLKIEEYIYESAKTEHMLETYTENTSSLHTTLKLLERKLEIIKMFQNDIDVDNTKCQIKLLKEEIINSNYSHVIVSNYTKIIWYYIKKYKWYESYVNLKSDDYDSIYKIFLAILHNIPIIPINSDKSITGFNLIDKTQTDKYDTYCFVPLSKMIIEFYKNSDPRKKKYIEYNIKKYQIYMKLNFSRCLE